MVDLVKQLSEDSKTAHPDSLRVMCGWGADEIKRLRALLRDALDGLHNDFEPDNQSNRYKRIKAALDREQGVLR